MPNTPYKYLEFSKFKYYYYIGLAEKVEKCKKKLPR
jgi:hypothetical protein